MKIFRLPSPDSIRPANPTEEQEFPFILDSQESEPVNFAGIPLRMLQLFPASKEVTIEWQIVTRKMESRTLRLSGDFAHFIDSSEEAAINRSLLLDEDVIAFVSHASTVDKVTGEKWREKESSTSPYVRVGKNHWTNVCPISGERDEVFTVTRERHAAR